jgi:hypothetical protein
VATDSSECLEGGDPGGRRDSPGRIGERTIAQSGIPLARCEFMSTRHQAISSQVTTQFAFTAEAVVIRGTYGMCRAARMDHVSLQTGLPSESLTRAWPWIPRQGSGDYRDAFGNVLTLPSLACFAQLKMPFLMRGMGRQGRTAAQWNANKSFRTSFVARIGRRYSMRFCSGTWFSQKIMIWGVPSNG